MEGPVVAHIETALAAMPLADGFQTQVRAFQPSTGSVQLLNVVVGAAESVETATGNFETFRLDLNGDDGETGKVWVTQAKPHMAVKVEQTQPAMGGAKVASVLTAVE